MRRREEALACRLREGIGRYEQDRGRLPGIGSDEALESLLEQLVESDRRSRYVRRWVTADIDDSRKDPCGGRFDPLKAAVLLDREGDRDEAFWMVFLFVHFGRHRKTHWRYAASVYGALCEGAPWTWRKVQANPGEFRSWLDGAATRIRAGGGGFGNHRKYESLSGSSPGGTGAAVESYVDWVGKTGSHDAKIAEVVSSTGGDAKQTFSVLYKSMDAIVRFGRTASFDYLTTVSRLQLADIVPDKAHLVGATGPLKGARLLFGNPTRSESGAAVLDARLQDLQPYLGVGFDVMEDALCNWQKSPDVFRPFRG